LDSEAAHSATEYEATLKLTSRHFAGLLAEHGAQLLGSGEPDGGRGQLAALYRLRPDLENIVESLRMAFATGDDEQLGAFGLHLQRFLEIIGELRQMEDCCRRLSTYAGVGNNPRLLQRALLGLARAEYLRGNDNGAAGHATQSLGLAREHGLLDGEEAAVRSLGIIQDYQGQYDEARASYLRSAELCRLLGKRSSEAYALNNLATLGLLEGNPEEAEAMLLEALAIHLETGELRGEGIVFSNLGLVRLELGKTELARRDTMRSLEIHLLLGDITSMFSCCVAAARVLVRLGQRTTAGTLVKTIETEMERIGYSLDAEDVAALQACKDELAYARGPHSGNAVEGLQPGLTDRALGPHRMVGIAMQALRNESDP
jgi:tetratricopeptide (TPR) repeat protein